MAEPISLIASGVGIADVAIRLIVYLHDVKAAADTIEEDVELLIAEVKALKDTHGELEVEYERHIQDGTLSTREKGLWTQTGTTLKEGKALTHKLESGVKEIYGDDPKVRGKRDALIKQHRKRSRDPRLSSFRAQLHTYQNALQLWLNFIQRCTADEQHEHTTKLLIGISDQLEQDEESRSRYNGIHGPSSYQDFSKASLTALENISATIKIVGRTLQQGSTNKHFDIPQQVATYYTGREDEAEQLAHWLIQYPSTDKHPQKQRRFVIYGVGGSGKTQFCCKFANDHRERFWGVFCIDGRSRELLKQTLSQNVARIAGVDANEKAALHWLSNLEERWLLIIDNADDLGIDLEEYLPKGNRGHILITTRNSANKTLGNIGTEFFEFKGLRDQEASSLLLKTAAKPQPWDSKVATWATKISKALGYLALAVAVAGALIREECWELEEYLDLHEQQRLRRPRRPSLAVTPKQDDSDGIGKHQSVEAAFDLSYRAIVERNTLESEDALQLLKIFAFLYSENIRFDFLKRAVTNRAAELRQQAEDNKRAAELKAREPSQPWSKWLSSRLFELMVYLYRNRSRPVLPDVIRDGRKNERFDKLRVRAALRQLMHCSLVTHNVQTDSYSLHPLVHKWAREMPGMNVGEQGVWCEAASVLLSSCILLPPLGSSIEDEELRKHLLPHVDHARLMQAAQEQRIRDKRMARMKPWPVFEGGFNSERALAYAKFSLVYAQNGRWEDAKRLQSAVKDFTIKVLGLKHPTTRRITLALAGTLSHLGQSDDAAKLQQQVLDACLEHMGLEHHDTLVAMQGLGESRFLQGRFSKARRLQEDSLAGLKKLHGLYHEDTLNAVDFLGRTVAKFYTDEDLIQARSLHRTAVDGMQKLHGSDHLRTLIAKENLCAVAVLTGEREHLLEAQIMMTDVLEIRKAKLGREHGYTLLAMVNLAQVKAALGDLLGAEELVLQGLPIAERNMGADHIAYLWGRYHLGKIWVAQERWKDAETLLTDVTQRQRDMLQGRGRHHPDRIGGLVQLATIYNALGKDDECDRVVEEALSALAKISTVEHPVATKLRADRERWRRSTARNEDIEIASGSPLQDNSPAYEEVPLFVRASSTW